MDAPVSHSRTFSYHVPDGMRLQPGQLVWVPFGRRTLQGLVMELAAAPQVSETRDIRQAVEPAPPAGRYRPLPGPVAQRLLPLLPL